MKTLAKSACMILGALTLLWIVQKEIDAALFGVFRVGADATDGESRSGMALSIDAATGCQYLLSPWGGISPRYGADGKQLCGARP